MLQLTPWHIQFEGAHGVGKDTLADAVAKQTGRFHSLHVRGPVSDWAFARLIRGKHYDLQPVAADWASMKRYLLVHIEFETTGDIAMHFASKHPNASYPNHKLAELIAHGVATFEAAGCKVLRLPPRPQPSTTLAVISKCNDQ